MKKFISLIPLCLIAVSLVPALSSGQGVGRGYSGAVEIQDIVIFPFFKALENGDVNEIRQYLSADMYNEYRTLLEENKEYPQFLRNYYRGAKFSMIDASEVDGEVEVDIIIEFPNGSQSINKLRVSKEMGGDKTIRDKKGWRISTNPTKESNARLRKGLERSDVGTENTNFTKVRRMNE